MRSLKILSIAAFVICVATAAKIAEAASLDTQTSSSPVAAVNQFYKYHFAHDMAFTPSAIKQRSAWLTPALLKASRAYFALPDDPDEVPPIDGDPFTGSQEYPATFSVGSPTTMQTSAQVPVTFRWKDGHSTIGTVVLIRVKNKWLIDDVKFADQDSLRQLLAMGFTAAHS